MLEDEADVAVARVAPGDVDAVEADFAGFQGFKPGDGAQQGGLARARGAEERHQFAVADGHVDTVERRAPVAGEGLDRVLDVDLHA